jgi:hypothetical protein
MIPNGMPMADPVGLCRYRAYYDQLRAFGLSHYVALGRLGNRLAGGVTERSMGRGRPAKLAGAASPR